MLSGTLSYRSHVEGIEFENIEIQSTEPGVVKLDVASDKEGNVSIVVHVEDVAYPSEAGALGLREATRVVNIMAIELGRHVNDPQPTCHALKNNAANLHVLGDWMKFSEVAQGPIKVGGESLATLTSALSDPAAPGEADYQLFRACLNTRDVTSRFLSLYRLLGQLAGRDRQSDIDATIKRHEPGVAETISPRSGQTETVYTKLRNEHMHRGHVPLTQVRSEMETHLPGLIAIGRMAIKNP